MGKAMKIEDEAPQVVKDAVDNEDISIHQGYAITRQVTKLPAAEQELAAEQAVAQEIAKHDKRRNRIDNEARIAKQFCCAFEKSIQIEPTAENIRIWLENAGVKQEHLPSMSKDARQIANIFTTIAEILEQMIQSEDWRTDIEDETNTDTGQDSHSCDSGK